MLKLKLQYFGHLKQRTDAFELWCWILRVPWIARRSNQSVLKEISPDFHWKDWSWSWSSNTLATWWEELTHWKRPWCWGRLKAGKEGDDRGRYGWMASLTWWTWIWASSRSWWWTGKPGVLQSMGVAKSWTWLSDWTPPPLLKDEHSAEIAHYRLFIYVCKEFVNECWNFLPEI